jgi:NADH-quinone oxidoreductase subunit G
MNASRACTKCSGKVTVWLRGDEVYRVTGRKDQFGEVEEFICNECRFEKKEVNDWTIEGPRNIKRASVISQNHYLNSKMPTVIIPLENRTMSMEEFEKDSNNEIQL